MIQITHNPIDLAEVIASVRTPEAGAVVLFLGTAREMTGGRRTTSLEYESYGVMAEQTLTELESRARRKWPVTRATIVHRLGHVELAEVSVAVAVSTPHRQDAFQTATWLIDSIKQIVPIWKKENRADGTSEWIHPGLQRPSPQGREGSNQP